MRSWLFVPGDSEKKLAKAHDSGADVLILDLEDSVAGDRKPIARGLVAEYLSAKHGGTGAPALYVRINPLSTPFWEDDLEVVMRAAPDGIVQPKPVSGQDVHRLSIALHGEEERNALAKGRTRVLAIATEVASALLDMKSYIGVSSRLTALTWGAEDLSANVGAAGTREADGTYTSPFMLARNLCLFTAVAGGMAPIDTVYVDFRNEAGLEKECRAAARDGFVGKMAIHPGQVAAINAAFTPSDAEIARAREIVRLFAENPGLGVVGIGGQMLDKPHLAKAERLLARARVTA
jgi:citrate lyase subunit beta/citryl-CoA lyase